MSVISSRHHVTNPAQLSISTLLFRHSPKLLVTAMLLGVCAGGLYSLIFPMVLAALNSPTAVSVIASNGALAFFGLCCGMLATKTSAIVLINNIAKSAAAELRIAISQRVSRMPMENLERLGFARLLNVLVDDVNRVGGAAVAIPMMLVSAVTVAGMLAYLATLNLVIFGLVLLTVALGVAMFQVPMTLAGRRYRHARALRDTVQEGMRGLVQGGFELKLNAAKAECYLDEEVVRPQLQAVRLEQRADRWMHLAGTASDLLAFVVIGIVVYVAPLWLRQPAANQYGVVMALLYIAAPVASILALLPQVRASQIALERIGALFSQPEEALPPAQQADFENWRELSASGLCYQYDAPDGTGFRVGPVNLHFCRGQVNFIVGGNGSGKTTLTKMVSLHYWPSAGELQVDGRAVNASNIASLRRRIGVIYSNYFLFSKLYRPLEPHDMQRVQQWLILLGLQGKTEVVNGQFTTIQLSDGQRRRLALLVLLLEDRDIYVFDEWAADQDPAFKHAFYRLFLPEMKRKNKLVLVISHDDRYFDCADQVIFMEAGIVRHIQAPGDRGTPSPATPEEHAQASPSPNGLF